LQAGFSAGPAGGMGMPGMDVGALLSNPHLMNMVGSLCVCVCGGVFLTWKTERWYMYKHAVLIFLLVMSRSQANNADDFK
jgi:hypothetical protein